MEAAMYLMQTEVVYCFQYNSLISHKDYILHNLRLTGPVHHFVAKRTSVDHHQVLTIFSPSHVANLLQRMAFRYIESYQGKNVSQFLPHDC
jgi:hypothetical protein